MNIPSLAQFDSASRLMKPNNRRCISCHQIAPKEKFWRIVRVYPSGQVQLNKGMGRSAYLCPQVSCLQIARQKKRLGRALKTAIPDDIYQSLEEALNSDHPILNKRSLP